MFDSSATHSFVSPIFTSKVSWQAERMITLLSVATPLSDLLDIDIFLGCPVLVENREFPVDLVLLDVILGMDWLSRHYATLDYCSKVVIFKISGEEEFKFLGDKSYAP